MRSNSPYAAILAGLPVNVVEVRGERRFQRCSFGAREK
jgi:hypothetical protein